MSGRIDYEHMDKNVKVDLKDRRILSLLSENARMPLTQIAKKVQLSRDAVNYRVKRLQDKGIILKFTANISYSKLGFKLFHIFLLLDERDKEKQKALIEQVKNHPNVLSVIEYSDRWDLEIAIIARNILEFDKILSGISESFPEIILEKEKLEVIRRYNSDYVPPLINESHITEKIEYYAEKTVQLDETDIKLLKILTEDSRMSTYIIGEKLGINADTVSYRIKKLLKENIIRFFTILVSFSLLKYHWYTFSIEMKYFNFQNEKKFEAFLDKNPSIVRSAKTLGRWDLLLYVVVENRAEYHHIMKDVKNVFGDIIKNYDTWIAYREHIFKTFPEIMLEEIKNSALKY